MSKRWRMWIITFLIICLLFYVGSWVFTMKDPTSQGFPLRKLWKNNLGEGVVSLSVANERLILVRTSGALKALDAKTGNIVWQHALSWQADPKWAVARNGKVYITDGNFLLAFDQEDGSVLWQQPTTYSHSWVTYASDSIVIVNQVGSDILVFDADNGEFLWRKPGCRGFVEAYADDQNVYIPCDDLEVIDIPSGETSQLIDINVSNDIGYSPGTIYYLSDSIEAYDTRNGKILWNTSVSNTGLISFRVTEEMLFYLDASRICMLSINNGDLKWCKKFLYPQTPSVIGNIVYVFDGNHKTITAIQLSDGQNIGVLSLSNLNYFIVDRQILTSISDSIFFANGGTVYAYGN